MKILGFRKRLLAETGIVLFSFLAKRAVAETANIILVETGNTPVKW